jgi:hypothetical protein
MNGTMKVKETSGNKVLLVLRKFNSEKNKIQEMTSYALPVEKIFIRRLAIKKMGLKPPVL